MEKYLDLLRHVKEKGVRKSDRTGTGTVSVFSYQTRFDLSREVPIVTTKKIHTKSVIHELLWFLSGKTNTQYLRDNEVTIWDEWADERGELGPVYGAQWRAWRTADGRAIDQISNVVEQIKKNPDSRRLIVSAWNVDDVEKMALPPCHCLFQFYSAPLSLEERAAESGNPNFAQDIKNLFEKSPEKITESYKKELEDFMDTASIPKRKLSCQLYQRSADVFLGVPFNFTSYGLLTRMVAQVTNHVPGDFVHTLGDAHIYLNHFDQVDLQLSRTPYEQPKVKLNPNVRNIFDFKYEDFKIEDYKFHPAIKAPIAV